MRITEAMIPQPSGQGEEGAVQAGHLLWYQDFDDLADDGNVETAEALTIFGSCTYPDGGGDAIFNFGGSDQQIIDASGDKFMRMYWDNGAAGPNAGCSVMKDLEADWGAPDSLDGFTDMWMSLNIRFENGFDEQGAGKMPGGFSAGEYLWVNSDDDANVPQIGTLIRKYFTGGGNSHTSQLFWYGETMRSGDSKIWFESLADQIGNTGDYADIADGWNTWENIAIHAHLPDSPPDSSTGYIEYFMNEVLVSRYDTLSLRMNDSIDLDWAMYGWFPANDDNADNDWYIDIDNLALFYFDAHDSTWTGQKWKTYTDSAFVIDSPGYPKGESETGWGLFGD